MWLFAAPIWLCIEQARADWPEAVVFGSGPDDAYSVRASDLDRDGDADAVIVVASTGALVWYENTGGARFFVEHTIDAAAIAYPWTWLPGYVRVADLDGDGDDDVAVAAWGAGVPGVLQWYENRGGVFGPPTLVTTFLGGVGFEATDVDRDGRVDLLLGADSAGEVRWHRNQGGAFAAAESVGVVGPTLGPSGVAAPDLDLDGVGDVVSVSRNLVWFRGLGYVFSAPVDIDAAEGVSVVAADLDGDGDEDVAWCGWTACGLDSNAGVGGATFGDPSGYQRVGVAGGANLQAADVDLDGSLDLLVAGEGGVRLETAASQYASNIALGPYYALDARVVDLDSDGLPDVLSVDPRGHLSWTPQPSPGAFGAPIRLSTSANSGTSMVGDIDQDGVPEVVTGTDGISWFPVRAGALGPPVSLTTEPIEPIDLDQEDLDGDGDLDLLVVGGAAPSLGTYWYRNDGAGRYARGQLLDRSCLGSAASGDVDGDGDADVVCGGDSWVFWKENLGGGQFADAREVVAGEVVDVEVADFDGDGREDVLAATWAEESCSTCPSGYEMAVVVRLLRWTPSGFRMAVDPMGRGTLAAVPADLDDDGLPDVLLGSGHGGVSWRRNLGGWSFAAEELLAQRPSACGPLVASDLDRDGDLDVVAGWPDESRVGWMEGLGGGAFAPEQVVSTEASGVGGLGAIDVDEDGRLDLVALPTDRDLLVWYANPGPSGTTDSGSPAAHTGSTGTHPATDSDSPIEDQPSRSSRCGCAVAQVGPEWVGLLLALAATRRRSGRAARSETARHARPPWTVGGLGLEVDR